MTDPPSSVSDSQDYRLGHLLRFGRLLRLMGVQVSLRQVLDLQAHLAQSVDRNRGI